MPSIYIIMGNQNKRKSSIIRCLTGTPRKKKIKLKTISSYIDIYVTISSLQEANIQPTDFITLVNENNYDNVLCCLWIRDKITDNNVSYPNGVSYINKFLNAGWSIEFVDVLGIEADQELIDQLGEIHCEFHPRSAENPSNQTAAEIRSNWGWA